MLAPWIVIKRTVFIYQYYIPSIITILMIGNACTHIRDTKNKKLITYVAVCVIVFFMFYPVISGLDVSKSYVNTVLKWLSSWTFMNYGN